VRRVYGRGRESRIADPANANRIFSWLICRSHDDKGNAIVYDYVAEDSANVDRSQANERNRTDASRSANRYLKRIRYGNKPSLLIQPDVTKLSWLFEGNFDYGEGHYQPRTTDAQGREFVASSLSANEARPVRQDRFSAHRSCFEVRTYRLCRRVLMFHHFPDELGTPDYLVRATEFIYRETPIASFITRVVQSGFVRQSNGNYLKRSLPPLEFEYSEARVQQEAREVDPESLANLPSSVNGTNYRWLDLDREGMQGGLVENSKARYHKRKLSPLRFDFAGGAPSASAGLAALNEVAKRPAFAEAGAPRHQFLDLDGGGQLDCVVLERPVAGFYERTQDENWEGFTPLPSSPNVDWSDPNLRFIDLDGDGHADILITEHDAITWYPSLADSGFGAPVRLSQPHDEEGWPALGF